MLQPSPSQTAPSQTPLLQLDGINKTYSRGDSTTTVLHDLSLQIHAGEFVAIVGQSGSGKSTLMNILGCLDRPSAGRYLCRGQEVGAMTTDQLAQLRRETFGFVFQQYNLLSTATAAENVALPAVYAGHNRQHRQQRAEDILTHLGLSERLHHRPSQLSGGQQQRVSIARALINGGSVILADEPTGALDSASGRDVMALLHRLHHDGHTVILITHDASIAAQAERVVTLSDGRITSDSGPVKASGVETRGVETSGVEAQISNATASSSASSSASAPSSASIQTDISEAVRMALRSLRVNLFRTALTLLGIIIGVGSVVAMLAFGEGAKQDVLTRIQSMGSNLLLVRAQTTNMRGSTLATLIPEDATAIASLPDVVSSVPETNGTVTLRVGNIDYQTTVTATSPDYVSARDWPVGDGLFFSAEDVRSYAPVIVLGSTVAQALFPDLPEGTSPLGRYVLANAIPFQVIGVMSEKGATPDGRDRDDTVFVPLSTGSLRLFGQRYIKNITVQAASQDSTDSVQEAITSLLTARHRATDFQVRNMASVIEMVTSTQDTMTVMLGSIAFISLLVGGIGVMNIMLVSVIERTREIGVRLAVGAQARNILLQFLTEALVVCALGGALGVGGGVLAALIGQAFGMRAVLTVPPMVLAFASAFFTGLVFGYMPARKAAHLDPVQALTAD